MLVDALMDDELYEEQMSGKYTDLKDFLYTEAIKSDWTAKLMNVTMKSNPNSSTIHWGFTGYVHSDVAAGCKNFIFLFYNSDQRIIIDTV